MKARQYTEEQIIAVLREGESGAMNADFYCKYRMSDATITTGKQITTVSPSANWNDLSH